MFEDLKIKILNTANQAEKDGLIRHGSGNFSIRDKETGYICITPTGQNRNDNSVDSILVVDIDGNIIENKMDLKPTSEMKVHLSAYKSRKDVMSVCHTHAIHATAFAVQNKEIPSVVFESVVYGTVVPVAKYATPGTQELGDSIVEPLKSSDACLLEKHGVITVGKSIEDAYLKMQYVEDMARIYLYALMMGHKEPETIPQSEFEKVFGK